MADPITITDLITPIQSLISAFSPIIIFIGALTAAYLGFRWNESSTLQRELRAEKKQIQSVRTLIDLEINHNLDDLKKFWDKINEKKQEEYETEDEKNLNFASLIIRYPLPQWNHGIWENQTSLLAVAFDEIEIPKIYDIHCYLDDLTLIYYKILKLSGKEEGEAPQLVVHRFEDGPMLNLNYKSNFEKYAPSLWLEFEEITNNLLEKGNPLKK